jgi:curli biogenesis system outer membrane secretion channel CsgG
MEGRMFACFCAGSKNTSTAFSSIFVCLFLALITPISSVFAEQASDASYPVLSGPKRTIAVGNFDAVGSFVEEYGQWDVGGGLAAMLTTALIQSNQFVVVERAQLTEILAEQGLAYDGLVTAETGAAVGRLSGAQLFVYGAVTEFNASEGRSGGSLGVSVPGLPLRLGGSSTKITGTVAMDIRVVDATTGQVLESHPIHVALEASGSSFTGSFSGISLGSEEFEQTPLGEASREAIQLAVTAITGTASQKAWQGQVVDFDGENIYINAGSVSGVKAGDRFMVERVAQVMTDPSTGEVLFVRKDEMGTVILIQVMERISIGSFSGFGELWPERGDFVVVMSAE